MSNAYYQLDDPLPTRGLWAVPVPWNLVPVLSTQPGMRQFAAELYVDPATKRAAVVLWPGVDPRWVTALFARMDSRSSSKEPSSAPSPAT